MLKILANNKEYFFDIVQGNNTITGKAFIRGKSKVKKLASVDVEAVQALKDFVDSVVSEGRLEWALNNMINEKLLPFEMTSMGEFIRLVYNDVMKEESDTIVANQLDPKKLGGPIANKARPWYIQRLNNS